jgi:hypothetical protein
MNLFYFDVLCLLRFLSVDTGPPPIFCRTLRLSVLSSAILYTVASYYTTEVLSMLLSLKFIWDISCVCQDISPPSCGGPGLENRD